MRPLINTLVMILLSLFLSSCVHYVPFTSNLKEKYALTNDDIKNVQFYLSHPLRLSREVTTLDSRKIAEGHTLKSVKGKLIEEINFSDKLPGIAMNSTEDTVDVSFEAGKWLTFVCEKGDWTHRYDPFCFLKEQQTVPSGVYTEVFYDGAVFQRWVYDTRPFLIVIEDDFSSVDRKKRDVQGIRLQDRNPADPAK